MPQFVEPMHALRALACAIAALAAAMLCFGIGPAMSAAADDTAVPSAADSATDYESWSAVADAIGTELEAGLFSVGV